jgi:mannosyltransferase
VLTPSATTAPGCGLADQGPGGHDGGGAGPRRPAARRLRRLARWASRDRFVVAAFCALGVVLRVPTIGRAYWIDEAISVGIASHPLRELPSLLRNDGSPPLWYLLLHGWLLVFGATPVSTHVLSLLLGIAAVPVAYWAGREIFDRTAGLAAAGLTATNPFLTWYSTQNRMYVALVALGAAAVACALRAMRRRTLGSAAAAVVAFAALDYTHYWGLYLTAVTAASLLVVALRSGDRQLRYGVLGSSLALGLIYLPWLPSFLEQARNTAAPWAVPPGIGDLFADPSTAIGGTAGAVVAPFLALVVWRTRQRRPPSVSADAALVAVLAGLCTVLGWLAAQVEPSWTVRYLAVTVGPWLLATAGALAPSRTGRRAIVAVCVGLSAFAVVGNLLPDAHPADTMDNAAAIAQAARPYLRPGDLVVVTQTEQTPVMEYYLGRRYLYANPLGPVHDPSVVDWYHIVARLQRADACTTIAPTIDALPVGAAILEVDPLDPVGTSGTSWAEAAHRQVVADEALLAGDRALRPVRSFTEAIEPRPYSPLVGELYRKVRAGDACA